MPSLPHDPQEEKEALYTAICTLHKRRGKSGMVHAFLVLCDAVERAERVLSELEAQAPKRDSVFQIHVLGLGSLVMCGQEEIVRVERYAREVLRDRRATERDCIRGLEAMFPQGTIISCPTCGEGLYKLTTRATTAEIVLDDRKLFVPLNRTVPSGDVWRSLACPFCGGRLFKDGQIHTLQQGWK